ncbi:hypothetical protein WP50_07420 [Lactiplantibacillus plantarum]|nr:hypothetical protein WP50_07420 [Lactiplantibacillus plantarum]
MIEVAEQNKPEMVLPLTNIPRSMQLIKQALSFMGQTFSDGLQMPAALTQSMDMSSLASQPSSTSTQSMNSGGINELGTSIVNAIVQGLQMTNLNNSDYYNAAGHTVIWGTPKFDWLHSGPIGHRRFANGGLVDTHQMIEVAEQNKPEMVLWILVLIVLKVGSVRFSKNTARAKDQMVVQSLIQ